MKKNIYNLFFVLLYCKGIFINAQTNREKFDRYDDAVYGYSGLYSNINNILNGTTTHLLESYLNMFKATRDLKYLNKFSIIAKRIQDRRDDNFLSAFILNPPPNTKDGCTYTGSQQYDQLSKGWTTYNTTDCSGLTRYFKESGEICAPMAEFIYLLKTDYADFQNEQLPEEVKSTNSDNNYGGATVLTFKNFADWLYNRIKETIVYS